MKNLKHCSICFFTLILLIAIGCRKKKEVEIKLASKPLHCYNLVMDEDETDVDQGGSCSGGSVSSFGSACGQPNNTVTIGSTTSSVTSCTKTTSGSPYYTYTLTFTGGGKITITTSSSVTYNSLLTYNTSGSMGSLNYDGLIKPSSSSSSYVLQTGNVKIKKNGSTYAVEICNSSLGTDVVNAYAIVN